MGDDIPIVRFFDNAGYAPAAYIDPSEVDGAIPIQC